MSKLTALWSLVILRKAKKEIDISRVVRTAVLLAVESRQGSAAEFLSFQTRTEPRTEHGTISTTILGQKPAYTYYSSTEYYF